MRAYLGGRTTVNRMLLIPSRLAIAASGHSLPSPLIVPGTQCPLRPVGDQIGRAAQYDAMGHFRTHHNSKRVLFDHLIGAAEQSRWHAQTKSLGGLEVDH